MTDNDMYSNTKTGVSRCVNGVLTNSSILILLIATIGMLPSLIGTGGYYIKGDITTQMLPFVYETKRMFASGMPFWSWNTYFGDNFIASYAYYTVFNPFTWINCLFPYKYLGLGFTLVLYLKFLVCGYVAQKYLKKTGFDDRLSLIGCLLYTFSSWAITNLYYYMFMEPMILFPFLLIFVERFLKEEKHGVTGLTMATFVVVAVNYYFASVNLIAATIYFFCRLLTMYKDRRDRFWLSVKAAGCVALGIACASVVLIPVLLQLKGSPHQTFYFDLLDIASMSDRLFWLLYPKTTEGSSYYLFLGSGCNSHAAWIAVFGILPTVLLYTKNGYGWIKWLTGLMVLIYLTPLNAIFSLFTECDYTRWAYTLTLAIIICTLYYIKDYGLPRIKDAIIYCTLVYGMYVLYTVVSAYWQYGHAGENLMGILIKLSMDVVLVAINAISLLLICREGSNGSSRFTAILLAVCICSTAQFMMFSFHGVKEYLPKHFLMSESDYFVYGDDFRRDGDFLYRTNFNLLRNGGWSTNNFALACNRPSIETFHSVQNTGILRWNDIVNDGMRRVFRPLNFVESFEALMSVKELALPSNEYRDTCVTGTKKGRDGHFTVYEYDRYIPMGFAYDRYLLADSVTAMAAFDSTLDIPKLLLSALAIEKKDEPVLRPYLKKADIHTELSFDSILNARRSVCCDSFIGHTRGFDAHIDLDSTAVVFFSVLADDGFTACIDGMPTKIYETNLGFSSILVPSGSHDISFRYFPPGLRLGLIISVLGWGAVVFLFYRHI